MTCHKCELPRYWDYLENTCKECLSENSHYNITLRQCYTCPYRYKYSLADNKCVIDETICEYDGQQFYDYDLSRCVCPKDKSFFTASNICVDCSGFYQYWSYSERRCIKCDLGTHYDSNINACAVCPNGQFFSEAEGACLNKCPKETRFNPESKECECLADYSHWNGEKCIECPPSNGQNFWF